MKKLSKSFSRFVFTVMITVLVIITLPFITETLEFSTEVSEQFSGAVYKHFALNHFKIIYKEKGIEGLREACENFASPKKNYFASGPYFAYCDADTFGFGEEKGYDFVRVYLTKEQGDFFPFYISDNIVLGKNPKVG